MSNGSIENNRQPSTPVLDTNAIRDDATLNVVLTDWIWAQQPDYAFELLQKYREENKISDVNCWHTLMEVYARQGDFEKISKIYSFLKDDGVTPKPQTYVFIFDCLAKITTSDENVMELLGKFINDAATHVNLKTRFSVLKI